MGVCAAETVSAGVTRIVKQKLELGKEIAKVLDGAVSCLSRNQPSDLGAWQNVKRDKCRVWSVQQVIRVVQRPVSRAEQAV
jgi:hypothetical protein